MWYTCPRAKRRFELTANNSRVYRQCGGKAIIAITCPCCDAYGYTYTEPEYNPRVPEQHFLEVSNFAGAHDD